MNHKYEYGCLMVYLDIPDWTKINSVIPQDRWYVEEEGFGFEDTPHVTILFGFHDNEIDLDKLEDFISKIKKGISVELTDISCFTGEAYDVIKFGVKSDCLHDLNKMFRDNFEHTNRFDKYVPHCTIGYVKPGYGPKYSVKLKNKHTYSSNRLVYSRSNGERIEYSITNENN